MIKHVPAFISPELLATLSEMGHGDTIVLADANFPAASIAKSGGAKYFRADGHPAEPLLDAILTLIPADEYVETPLMLMSRVPRDESLNVPIWKSFASIATRHGVHKIGFYERFEFYEQAKRAYCILQSGETALYANIIIQKGVIRR